MYGCVRISICSRFERGKAGEKVATHVTEICVLEFSYESEWSDVLFVCHYMEPTQTVVFVWCNCLELIDTIICVNIADTEMGLGENMADSWPSVLVHVHTLL